MRLELLLILSNQVGGAGSRVCTAAAVGSVQRPVEAQLLPQPLSCAGLC